MDEWFLTVTFHLSHKPGCTQVEAVPKLHVQVVFTARDLNRAVDKQSTLSLQRNL